MLRQSDRHKAPLPRPQKSQWRSFKGCHNVLIEDWQTEKEQNSGFRSEIASVGERAMRDGEPEPALRSLSRRFEHTYGQTGHAAGVDTPISDETD